MLTPVNGFPQTESGGGGQGQNGQQNGVPVPKPS